MILGTKKPSQEIKRYEEVNENENTGWGGKRE
jgi:hypothetical protein